MKNTPAKARVMFNGKHKLTIFHYANTYNGSSQIRNLPL